MSKQIIDKIDVKTKFPNTLLKIKKQMNEFTEYHAKLANEELVRIAYFELRKYKKEARISAKDILRQRNLTKDQIELLKNEIRERKRKESRQKLNDKNITYGSLDLILDIICSS